MSKEQDLREVLDATPFPVAVVDLEDDKIFYWSRSAHDLFGHTAPTASEWYKIAYPDPEYRQNVIERWKPFLEIARKSQKAVNTGEYQVTCRDGSVRICEIYAAFLPTRLIVTFNDITEKKKSQQMLEIRESKLLAAKTFSDTIINKSPFATWVSDSNGTIIRTNRFLRKLLNLTAKQIHGNYNVLKDTNLEKQGVMPQVQAVFKKHKPTTFSIAWKAQDAGEGDYKSARDLSIDVTMFPILDESRKLRNVVCQWVDVTKRQIAEEVLQNEKDRAQLYLDIAGVMLIVLDVEQKVQEINPKGCEILGYSRAEIIGQNWFDKFLPGEDTAEVKKVFDQIIAGDIAPVEYYENPIIRKDGSLRQLAWHNSMLKSPAGEVIGIFSSGEDITERKKTEEELKQYREHLEDQIERRTRSLRAANKELENFAYSVSHDLRAPLRSIIGFSEIISSRYVDQLNKEGLQYFNFILEAGNNMAKLIEDLLHYSRLGKKEVETIELSDLLGRLMQDMEEDMKQVGAEITYPDDLPAIKSCRALLNQILLNLIQNGIIYHRPGIAPKIALTVIPQKKKIKITVKDNGIGIPEEYHDKIFNIFQRLHSQDEYPGTGIGLAIVKKAITALNGKIWLRSKVGKGTTFYLELPITKESLYEP